MGSSVGKSCNNAPKKRSRDDPSRTRSSLPTQHVDKNNSHQADVNFNNAHFYSESTYNNDNKREEYLLKWDLSPPWEVRDKYSVLSVDSSIDKKETILIEKCSILKYKTPFFRASACVLVPVLPEGVCVQLGWVQAIKDMIFINQYGTEGITSWEFPELTTGKCRMISDSDGHLYPWYGNKKELVHISGPTTAPTQVSVSMNDSFSPQVTWHVPVSSYSKEARLTKVFRNQSFVTCLVALHTITKTSETRLSVLKAISWNMRVEINVQPKLPVGQRASIACSSRTIPQPVLEDIDNWDLELEDRALHPPNANKCQMLVWRPPPQTDTSCTHRQQAMIIHNGLPDSCIKNYFNDTEYLDSILYKAIS